MFTAPTRLADVLSELAVGARPVAGGTDLVVGSRQGKAPLPERLVSIHRVAELGGIASSTSGLRLGSLVTHADIINDASIVSLYTALADASSIVGSHATRAQGTIGGNVMNASPAMDCGGPLLCFDAAAVLSSSKGTRRVALTELYVGPGRTTASPDELLVHVELPTPAPNTGSCYVRLEYRRQMEIAIVGATAVVTLDGSTITSARIAMTALAPTIHRVPEAEALLTGTNGSRSDIDAAAAAFAAAATPISDVRASATYRTAMAAVICRRAITGALARSRGESVAVPASTSLRGVR